MTGDELVHIRKSMGLGRRAMARYLGYCGSAQTNFKVMTRYEIGLREIPVDVARKVRALHRLFTGTGKFPDDPESLKIALENA